MNTDGTGRPASRQIGRMIAAITLVLLGAAILWFTYRIGLGLAWGSPMAAAFGLFIVLPLWLVWSIVASYLCFRRAKGYAVPLLLCIIIAAGSLVGMGTLAGLVATTTRNREIQQAIDQGLYADCIALLDHWPSKQSRIFLDELPLPRSIVVFDPAYITNDAMVNPELGPPNIGLCKNGFGGFAEGIRVFRNDEDAQQCITARGASATRIAPGVYYWREST